MFRKIVFYDNLTDAMSGTWWMFVLQGALLILFGLAVLFWPEILVAMIAAAFIFLGALFVALGLRTRRLRRDYVVWRDRYWEPHDL